MVRFFVLALALLSLAAVPARAACEANAGDAEITRCLAQDLRDSDKRINAVYQALMGALDDAGKTALRDAQRAWLRNRDKACSLDNKESDRERWLQAIMIDPEKTSCVVRFTFARVGELDAMLKQRVASPPPSLPPAPQAPQLAAAATAAPPPAGLNFVDDGYKALGAVGRRTGKWYYEIWIDRGRIAELGDLLVTPGYITNGPGGVVRMVNIRRSHVGAAPISVGWAIDLDNGHTYGRTNGTWANQPGTTGGIEVKLNRDYRVSIEGSSDIRALIARGLIKVNLGDRPFEYALPDGYRPFAEK